MKFFILNLFLLATTCAFAQERSSTATTASSGTTGDSQSRISCCYQIIEQDNGTKMCKVKFVEAPKRCPGKSGNDQAWQTAPSRAIKKCLAVVPNYNYSQPASGQIDFNRAYILNPCNL